jgi:hypothetical protein
MRYVATSDENPRATRLSCITRPNDRFGSTNPGALYQLSKRPSTRATMVVCPTSRSRRTGNLGFQGTMDRIRGFSPEILPIGFQHSGADQHLRCIVCLYKAKVAYTIAHSAYIGSS